MYEEQHQEIQNDHTATREACQLPAYGGQKNRVTYIKDENAHLIKVMTMINNVMNCLDNQHAT